MKTKLIATEDFQSVVVQCACIGHCSYIEFFTLYGNYIHMAITSSTRKRKEFKEFNKIEEKFNLNLDQLEVFTEMLDEIETVHSNTFVIRNKETFKADLYIRFVYTPLQKRPCKYDVLQVSFYTSEHRFKKDKPSFDITMSRPMIKDLVKSLKEFYEDKQGQETANRK